MKRPSYLQQLAARAAPRVGRAVVVPPRLLFRAEGVGGVLEANTPAAGEIADVARRSSAPAASNSRESPASLAQARASMPASGESLVVRGPSPADLASKNIPKVNAGEMRESQSAPQTPMSASSVAVPQALASRTAATSTLTQTAVPIAQTTPALRNPNVATTQAKTVMNRGRATLEQIAAAARIVPPRTDDRGGADDRQAKRVEQDANANMSAAPPTLHTATSVTTPPPPLPSSTRRESPALARRIEPAAAALVPQPTPPPLRAKAESTIAGLHIGTLEVHLSAPPATPTKVTGPAPRAARPAAGTVRRISRGFGVFGLGQS